MENTFIYEDKDEEIAEQRLAELIKEAGEDVRKSNKKAMEKHYEKIRNIVEKVMSKKQDAIIQ
jgi:hypothetical protein